MFAHSLRTIAALAVGGLTLAACANTGSALAEAPERQLHIELTDVRASAGKLYVSVQTEGNYMANTGEAGGIYEISTAGSHSYAYTLPEGEYAVSIWHDIDDDGVFSVDERGVPTDGWATSAPADLQRRPTFADARVALGAEGAEVVLPMIYAD